MKTIESQEKITSPSTQLKFNAPIDNVIAVNISSRSKERRRTEKSLDDDHLRVEFHDQEQGTSNKHNDTLNMKDFLNSNPLGESSTHIDNTPQNNLDQPNHNASQKSMDSFSNEKIKETMLEKLRSADGSVTDHTNHLSQTPKSSKQSIKQRR